MARVNASWTLPSVARDQRPIAHVEVELAVVPTQGAPTFSTLTPVAADAAQSASVDDVDPGAYQFRFTVVDVDGARGVPVVTPFSVPFAAPGSVVNVQVVVE